MAAAVVDHLRVHKSYFESFSFQSALGQPSQESSQYQCQISKPTNFSTTQNIVGHIFTIGKIGIKHVLSYIISILLVCFLAQKHKKASDWSKVVFGADIRHFTHTIFSTWSLKFDPTVFLPQQRTVKHCCCVCDENSVIYRQCFEIYR